MTTPRDLRDWIALLEREGELVRVGAEVDPNLEITEIVDRVVKSGGPALLFENPKSPHPLLINQFGTERRMCLAFGAESLDDVGRRLGDVLEMQPPQGPRPRGGAARRRGRPAPAAGPDVLAG
jgi:4-hydroxy-3-polyprenylbenzoate decarboxylase